MSFNRYPGGADPFSRFLLVASFVENFFQRALVGSRCQEEVNRFVEGRAGLIGGLSAAHDIERHGVGNELIAFLPHLNRIFDVHRSYRIIADLNLSLRGGEEMRLPIEKLDRRRMREMFSTIAPRYDFVTRTFSYGMDRRWKRLGVQKASLPVDAVVLDLACGTGDFSQLVRQHRPGAQTVALDLTQPMLRLARRRGLTGVVCGDAASLPFADASFDCVAIGYGLRNFRDLDAAVQEIGRVTRPGGLLVSLDFFLPKNHVLRRLYLGFLYAQGAFWGTLLHANPRVYTYIPDSLRSFVSMEEFSSLLRRQGYARVETRGYIFGGIGLHWAVKTGNREQGIGNRER